MHRKMTCRSVTSVFVPETLRPSLLHNIPTLGRHVVKGVMGTLRYVDIMNHAVDFYGSDIKKSLLTTQLDTL